MLKDVVSIKLQGANFSSATVLKLFDSSDGKWTKLSLVYGRNGSGKSTIAKAIRRIAGEEATNITASKPLDAKGMSVAISETEQALRLCDCPPVLLSGIWRCVFHTGSRAGGLFVVCSGNHMKRTDTISNRK